MVRAGAIFVQRARGSAWVAQDSERVLSLERACTCLRARGDGDIQADTFCGACGGEGTIEKARDPRELLALAGLGAWSPQQLAEVDGLERLAALGLRWCDAAAYGGPR